MTLFTITVYVLFHFGLDRDSLDGELASGVLWVTLLLAAVIGVSRLFATEREQGGVDGLLLAPVDRTSLFVAKAAALFLFLCAVELVAVPAFAVLLLGPGLGGAFPELLVILLLGNLGIAASARWWRRSPRRNRARADRAASAAPLLVPVLIGCAQATEPLFRQEAGRRTSAGWLSLSLFTMWCSCFSQSRSSTFFSRTDVFQGPGPTRGRNGRDHHGGVRDGVLLRPERRGPGFRPGDLLRARAMAIVALCRFVAGACSRSATSGAATVVGPPLYVAIHMSIILGLGVLVPGAIWQRRPGGTGGSGTSRCSSHPRGLPPVLRLLPAALFDRGPRAAGALLVRVRHRRRRVRAADFVAVRLARPTPPRVLSQMAATCRATCG